ncbi:MAG: hypothetical protein ABIJ34_01260 [archaeon]
MRKIISLLLMMILLPLIQAMDASYNVVVEDNGMSLIVIELTGRGLVTIPLQLDVSEVKVKGALYRIENMTLEVSIASTENAVVLYQTNLLTKKDEDWQLHIELLNNSNLAISFPDYAIIKESHPAGYLSSGNINKLVFSNASSVEVVYNFKDKPKFNYWPVGIGAAITLLVIGAVLIFRKKKPKQSNKDKILRTLSHNERIVVKALIENGEMKRNELERLTKMAKSSLANTLANLEKKNIIEVDKTYTTHFIKFTGWFSEL